MVPAGAEPRVEVERVAVLEVLGRADAAHGVPPRGADVGEAEDAALELDVGEEVGQAEVLSGKSHYYTQYGYKETGYKGRYQITRTLYSGHHKCGCGSFVLALAYHESMCTKLDGFHSVPYKPYCM